MRHERLVKVADVGTPRQRLVWGSNHGAPRRAYGPPDGLQKEQRLTDDEFGRCFSVTLDGGKVVVLMAPTAREKAAWVRGVNAVVGGLLARQPAGGAGAAGVDAD